MSVPKALRGIFIALFVMILIAGAPKTGAASDLDTVVSGNNEFALVLYQELSSNTGNIFLSPYSISSALAMAYAGAKGNTAEQMAEVMRYRLPNDQLHKAFSEMDGLLNGTGKDYKLSVANALWSQVGLEFVADYLKTVQRYYGAGFELVDFARKTEDARLAINRWVEDKTEKKIIDLIKPGVLDSLTRLVLTNAIYFKGQWDQQFPKDQTVPSVFNLTGKDNITVPFMNNQGTFDYMEDDTLQALEMPYKGKELSMMVILPKAGSSIKEVEKMLTSSKLQTMIMRLMPATVKVSIPKFKFEAELGLGGYLQQLGMVDAFSEIKADFSGISKTFLYITHVLHKAFIEVNEEGSEAAAATAVVMGTKSVPAQPAAFVADRPFFFIIREMRTGSILFMGRMADPR